MYADDKWSEFDFILYIFNLCDENFKIFSYETTATSRRIMLIILGTLALFSQFLMRVHLAFESRYFPDFNI